MKCQHALVSQYSDSLLVRQPRLLDLPMCGVSPVSVDEANGLLIDWSHYLGPINRPCRQDAYVLEVHQEPVSVAVSASIVKPDRGRLPASGGGGTGPALHQAGRVVGDPGDAPVVAPAMRAAVLRLGDTGGGGVLPKRPARGQRLSLRRLATARGSAGPRQVRRNVGPTPCRR